VSDHDDVRPDDAADLDAEGAATTGGINRRTMMVTAAGVAGAVWVAPTVLSANAASAASAPPINPPPIPGPNIIGNPNFATPPF
jgi:hypothetical protein